MSNSFDRDNNEQLVHGAVENALNAFTGDLTFPENFPTDAPHQNAEAQHQQQIMEAQMQAHMQAHPHPAAYDPAQQHQQEQEQEQEQEQHIYPPAMDTHVNSFESRGRKSKKQKSTHNIGRWTESEHSAFLHGVQQHGKDYTKIAPMIPTRTLLQVRTHAQKHFQKLEKAEAEGFNTEQHGVMQQKGGFTSPVAAQTLLGMSQLGTGNSQPDPQQQLPRKRKLNMAKSKPKKPNQCQYKNCKNEIYKHTRACEKHQMYLCTFPYCDELVELDTRFSQKRELCAMHFAQLTSKTRSMYASRAERP